MRVQELTKQYDGKTVVDGVSFAIPKGKVISLIGPNGAGKSTVMGMISRLIAHDSGLVDFEGKDIGKWKSKELSKRLAILTQSNNIQMKLTVRELVTFGRFPYGGTYAHKEIAFEFASWISVEFKLYLVKEFERLKTEEMKQLGWDIKRNLVKINYRIHTDAIKENLIPPELSAKQVSMVYASEADVLNMALFGMTAKQWRDSHPDLKGNIRDYANVSQLVCLSNLENLNAVFISEGMSQAERLTKLNAIAISQMEILTQDHRIEALEAHSEDLSPME
ncbi:hypothetical protein B5G34_04490 [Flavonifractor sp. An82]|uniref:ATP-binding cassette domain-containing protein n=1 Tax=Flavonifractor sp. An82 TaxID=1965660 RepID=UPI000B37B02F|nr:ATP-binding cassette domain-containing protein [Flavonifractor sp. An82]OUN23254.1 hypothetical protein B5G34_04490 [Flavonifractor sp. An82]